MKKTVCVYHSIDLDGWMSAAIVRYWFEKEHGENALIFNTSEGKDKVGHRVSSIYTLNTFQSLTFMGYNYGDPIPDLSEYDRVIMCDISFPIDIIIDLHQKLKDNFIIIDHHKSFIESIRKGLCLEGILNWDFAACELTWKYFMSNPIEKFSEIEEQESMPEIVRLLGRWDNMINVPITDKDELLNVIEFQYGAKIHIHNYEDAYEYLINWIEQEKNKHVKIGSFKTMRGWNQISIDIFQTGRDIRKYFRKKDKDIIQYNLLTDKMLDDLIDELIKDIQDDKAL
jgi:hypothetical protein